jgi:hypothetical protein
VDNLVYISFPYPFTLPDVGIVMERAAMARKWCFEMLGLGYATVCPLLHHHLISTHGDPSENRWVEMKDLLLKQMDSCDAVQILKFKGWEESLTVKDTILYAQLIGKPIAYIDAQGLEVWWQLAHFPVDPDGGDSLPMHPVPVRALENRSSGG